VAGLLLATACFIFGAVAPNAPLLYYHKAEFAGGLAGAVASGIGVSNLARGTHVLETLKALVAFDVYSMAAGWGLVVAGVAGLGWGLAFARWKRLRFFVLVVMLVSAAILFFPGLRRSFPEWIFLMSAPLSIGAGYLVYRLFWRARMPAAVGIILMAVFTVALSAQGVMEAAVLTLRKSAADTRCRYAAWAEESLPDGADVLATPQARFLNQSEDLESGGEPWEPLRLLVLAAWNDRAFDVRVLSVPPGGIWVPPFTELERKYDYLAVDTWSLEDLRFIAETPVVARRIEKIVPGRARTLASQNPLKAAAALSLVEAAREGGQAVKVIPEPAGGLAGFGPGIEVIRLSPPSQPPGEP